MPARKTVKEEIVSNDIDMNDSDSQTEQVDPCDNNISSVKSKPRKSVVDKIDHVIALVNQEASTSLIVKNLQSIRKVLDGAHIKSLKKSRQPNAYNLFMSEEMEKLKDSTMPATAKFKHCINLWNERKMNNVSEVAV